MSQPIPLPTMQLTSEREGRLDVLLSEMAGVTRSKAKGWIENGDVTVNGAPPVKAGMRVNALDTIEVIVGDDAPAPSTEPQDLGIVPLYMDDDVVVINKPRGMVTHPAPGHPNGTLVNAVRFIAGSLSEAGGSERPGVVHRLDMDTTGLIVLARNDASHVSLSEQFATREAGRIYLAVATGVIRDDDFSVNAPIARHPADRKRMAVVSGGREARTHFAVIERLRGSTLLRAKLDTGRTHQIRVHLSHIHRPVLGDAVYNAINRPRASVLMLHARELTFMHPRSGEPMSFLCEPPEDFTAVVEGLREG